MSIASDTFTRWLDVLVDTIDEPDLTGDQVAGLLHVSRYHLDRIVSAAAGEAPSPGPSPALSAPSTGASHPKSSGPAVHRPPPQPGGDGESQLSGIRR